MSNHSKESEKKIRKLREAVKPVFKKESRYEAALVQNTRILVDILSNDRGTGVSVINAQAGLIKTYLTKWNQYLTDRKLGGIVSALKSIQGLLEKELDMVNKTSRKQSKKRNAGRDKVVVGSPLDADSQKEFNELFGEEPRRTSSALEKIAMGTAVAIGLGVIQVLFGVFMSSEESEMEKRITTVRNELRQVPGKNVVVDKYKVRTPDH